MVNVSEEIKQYMRENNISYRETAKRIGWSSQNLWDKLNKRAEPNMENVKRIVESLGGTIEIESCHSIDATKLFTAVENEQIGYSVVEKILNSVGCSLKINLPK